MGEVYILKNQNNEFLDKSGGWATIHETKSFYRTPHKDEALNQKVEFSVKRPELRIAIETAQAEPNGKVTVNEDIFNASQASPVEDSHEASSDSSGLLSLAETSSNDDEDDGNTTVTPSLFDAVEGDAVESDLAENDAEESDSADTAYAEDHTRIEREAGAEDDSDAESPSSISTLNADSAADTDIESTSEAETIDQDGNREVSAQTELL